MLIGSMNLRNTWAAIAVFSAVAVSGATATGIVYEDVDRNGLRGANEPGVANVAVSNGVDVVPTDADGRYEIDVDDQTIVFITKPAGYMTPVDGKMLPRFYYIHQPDGSPSGLRYAGIAPTGDLPASVDFALVRVDEPAKFEALLFADTQPQTSVEIDYIRDDLVA